MSTSPGYHAPTVTVTTSLPERAGSAVLIVAMVTGEATSEAEGTDKGAGKLASASISSVVVGNLDDADKFFAYVKKTGYFHLMQRRLSDPAIRELLASKGSIPGVTPFTKVRLNLRVLSGA